jgi:hypothetical protein
MKILKSLRIWRFADTGYIVYALSFRRILSQKLYQ